MEEINNPNSNISLYSFENFFKVYQDGDISFYNLLKNITINVSDNSLIDQYFTTPTDTWYYIAFKQYGTMDLWWLILTLNPNQIPGIMPEPGTLLNLIKPELINSVITQITQQLNR